MLTLMRGQMQCMFFPPPNMYSLLFWKRQRGHNQEVGGRTSCGLGSDFTINGFPYGKLLSSKDNGPAGDGKGGFPPPSPFPSSNECFSSVNPNFDLFFNNLTCPFIQKGTYIKRMKKRWMISVFFFPLSLSCLVKSLLLMKCNRAQLAGPFRNHSFGQISVNLTPDSLPGSYQH